MTISADCDPIYLFSLSMHGGSLARNCTSGFFSQDLSHNARRFSKSNITLGTSAQMESYRDERLLKPDLGVQRFGNSLEEFAPLQPWRAVHEDIGPQLTVLVQ